MGVPATPGAAIRTTPIFHWQKRHSTESFEDTAINPTSSTVPSTNPRSSPGRTWRPVAESLVDVIHAVDPRALVLVSGVDWGYDLSGALDNPVDRPNVVYETHPYPWKGEAWKSVLSDLDKTEAVFLGEWGYGHSEDPVRTREDYGRPLIEFCQTRSIGWTAWIWHDEWTPSMLTSFRTFDTTDFGDFVKVVLNNGQ